jgi:hypothetical protein
MRVNIHGFCIRWKTKTAVPEREPGEACWCPSLPTHFSTPCMYTHVCFCARAVFTHELCRRGDVGNAAKIHVGMARRGDSVPFVGWCCYLLDATAYIYIYTHTSMYVCMYTLMRNRLLNFLFPAANACTNIILWCTYVCSEKALSHNFVTWWQWCTRFGPKIINIFGCLHIPANPFSETSKPWMNACVCVHKCSYTYEYQVDLVFLPDAATCQINWGLWNSFQRYLLLLGNRWKNRKLAVNHFQFASGRKRISEMKWTCRLANHVFVCLYGCVALVCLQTTYAT